MDKKAQAIELKLKGLTYAEIGKALGVSRQRAQQLVRPPQAIYALVRQRANLKCESCGTKLEQGHVHHRMLEACDDFNDVSNLLYLCISCHSAEHEISRPMTDSERPQITLRFDSEKQFAAVRKAAKADRRSINQYVLIAAEQLADRILNRPSKSFPQKT